METETVYLHNIFNLGVVDFEDNCHIAFTYQTRKGHTFFEHQCAVTEIQISHQVYDVPYCASNYSLVVLHFQFNVAFL